MKWSLLELKKYRDEPLVFSETADVSVSLTQRDPGIITAEPVRVTGTLTVNQTEYIVNFNIETVLTLASTRSLEPVPYPMSLDVMEIYMTPEQFASQKELIASDEIVMVLEKDLIDLTEAVEDHLLLALPLQVLTEEEKLNDATVKGQSWELMSEDAYYQKQEQQEETNIDPRLAKLSALLDNNKDSDDK
ncbi:YceD family protein [Vagococcus intermedius]|uniref:YceD family protein n=1 Tax=Vagococcus intermedius TaxID=2991418 RepID=A0AAF0CTR0_9ENTE|nr:YceD family protein [Vagococcus intermedius]WEG72694.1 YceD family protein [Vagococcus intermedius]WEG74779.1 YceD family protein [Vagococcus intermedius]